MGGHDDLPVIPTLWKTEMGLPEESGTPEWLHL